ncbi:helix-turn-helix domain-containing protein [Streptococcus mutans]|nr:helix-turn-helix domain-containing protein [Streptococcus mutans]NLQ59152.1 helix-turn-helix domain-containing protein [Streptococcus mutans]
MSKRSSKSVAEKLEIVLLYLERERSISTLTRHSGVDHPTIKDWVRKYKGSDIEGLKESRI